LLDNDAARADLRRRLAVVRNRGFSLGLINEAQREFASTLYQLARDPGATETTNLRDLASQLSYDPIELTTEAKNDVRVIAAPVFDATGRAVLVFTVYGFSRPEHHGGIDAYIARTVEASRRATELLGGSIPVARDDSRVVAHDNALAPRPPAPSSRTQQLMPRRVSASGVGSAP